MKIFTTPISRIKKVGFKRRSTRGGMNAEESRGYPPLLKSDRHPRLIFLGFFSLAFLTLWSRNQGWGIPLWGNPIKYLTGIPCPFCGMTRSMMMILRGDYAGALSFHLFGFPVFIALWVTMILVVIELITGRSILPVFQPLIDNRLLKISASVAFSSYYVLRLYARFGTGNWHDILLNSAFGSTLLSKVHSL